MKNIKSVKRNIKNEKDFISGIEDRAFPYCFMILKISGYWKPTAFKKPLNTFYDIYAAYCYINVIILLVTLIVNNIVSENSLFFLIENLFLIITVVNALIKSSNINFRRSNILGILQTLTDIPWNILRDDEETKIINESLAAEK
jgi:hypothetical protein